MQPLSRVSPNAEVIFGRNEDMASRPEVAVKISQCIAEWADIESMLGMLLAILLDGDQDAALAMYSGVENRSSQMKMLESAARIKIPEKIDLFTVLMGSVIRPAMRERDRLAHWCWGFSPNLADALLLIQIHSKMAVHLKAVSPPNPVQLDFTKIFVVTANDLGRTFARLQTAKNYLADFIGTIWTLNPPETRDRVLHSLCSKPEIRAALDRLIASRNKNSESPPQSPPPDQSDEK